MRQGRISIFGGDALGSIANGVRDRAVKLASVLLVGLRAWWPVISFVAAYILVVGTLMPLKTSHQLELSGITGMLAEMAFLSIPVFAIVRLAVYAREGFPARPIRRLMGDFGTIIFNPARLLSLVILFPVISLFLQAFAVAKGNIAFVNPFSWDEFFMQLDRSLHAGMDPWRLLAPVLSSIPATFMINFFYNFWFFLSVGSLLWVVLQRKPDETAIRYLVAFMLCWVIGGNVIAMIFSSAGPAYFGRLGLLPDPYAPLMAHLRAVAEVVPIWALDTQEMLWQSYLAQDVVLGGISAFPSMHNAQIALIALLAWQLSRIAGWLMIIYAVLIAIGSVWLGWHYAVDAYAGIFIAIACWWLAKPVARWMLRRPAMRELVRLQETLDTGGRG